MTLEEIRIVAEATATALKAQIEQDLRPILERLSEIERTLTARAAEQVEVAVSEEQLEGIKEMARRAAVAACENAVNAARAALPLPKDGEPGKDGVNGRDGKDGQDGRDGRDVEDIEVIQTGDVAEFRFTVGDMTSAFEVHLPRGEPGEPGRDGEPGPAGERGQDGKDGAPGKLGIVRAWTDAVHYEGDVVAHAGSTWQALRDTGRAPPADDWICIAERGSDGQSARQLVFLGTWDAEATYEALNVVALNGASFVAKRNDPGPCPGEHWQLMAGQGKRGAPGLPGERGEKGERGEPGSPVVALDIDSEGLLTLTNGDGSTVTCDLYPVLSKL